MLRNVSELIKNQIWFALVVELLVITVGVFMGLQVQEWNQERTDRSEERAYLDRLTSDFTAIDRDLERCLSVYRDSIKAVRFVSRTVDGHTDDRAIPIDNRTTFENALIRATAGTIPAGRSATFLEMLSTGDLSILRDAVLRDALIAYDERAQVSRDICRSIREESIAYMQPLYAHIKLDVELDADHISSIREYDLAAMARDPRFQTMLNVLAGSKGNNYELCQVQRALVEKAQDLLSQSENTSKNQNP